MEYGRLLVRTGAGEAAERRAPASHAYRRSHKRVEHGLPLPPGADAQAMTRVDGEGLIEILVARRRERHRRG